MDAVGHTSSPWQRSGRAVMTDMCRELLAGHDGWMMGHSAFHRHCKPIRILLFLQSSDMLY
jgi:hypothetical protein